MKLMKLNVVALAVFTVLGLASFDIYAGGCGTKCGTKGAHNHEVSEEAKACDAKEGKAECSAKKACCGKEGCEGKKACSEEAKEAKGGCAGGSCAKTEVAEEGK